MQNWSHCVGFVFVQCFAAQRLCLLSSFAVILTRKRELAAMLCLPGVFDCYCSVALSHCAVGYIGLHYVIVASLDHAHLHFLL